MVAARWHMAIYGVALAMALATRSWLPLMLVGLPRLYGSWHMVLTGLLQHMRRVGADCAVEVDGNAYSVPWRLIGERVRVTVGGETIRILHGRREVAVHTELKGRHGRIVDDRHLAGLVGTAERPIHRILTDTETSPPAAIASTLLRPLSEYEAAVGGGF